MERVHAELGRRRQMRAEQASAADAQRADAVLSGRGGRIVINDLLVFHDREFIQRAYLALLGRYPDSDGERTFLTRLRDGRLTKAEVLGRLRFSPEGRGRRVRVAGLLPAFALQSLFRLPLIGFVLSWINWCLRLPVMVRNFQTMEAHSHAIHAGLRQQLEMQAEEIERLRATVREQGARERGPAVAGEPVTDASLAALRADFERQLRALSAQFIELRATREQDLASAGQLDQHHSARLDAKCRELAATIDVRGATLDARLAGQGAALEQLQAEREALAARVACLSSALGEEQALAAVGEGGMLAQVMQLQGRLDHLLGPAGALEERATRVELAGALDAAIQPLQARILRLQEGAEALAADPALTLLRLQLHRDGQERDLLDAFYLAFENRFRGSREVVKQRAAHYLPIIVACDAGSEGAPILDIGCGRGEWLELLAEQGRRAIGIDLNARMLEECRSRGLEVQAAEASAHLAALPADSLGAITAIHVVEHLRFAELVQLVDLCLRALRPGGVLILETPNPENLQVGACNFYMDPTHGNPLPPLLLEYLLQSRGLVRCEIHRLSENRGDSAPLAPLSAVAAVDPELRGHVNAVVATLNPLLHAAPDYAVVAYKA